MIAFVKCSEHKLVRLSIAEFRRQVDSDNMWRCPKCRRTCELVQLDQSQVDHGCTQCHQPITDSPLFSERYWALFCDVICLGAYEARGKCRSR